MKKHTVIIALLLLLIIKVAAQDTSQTAMKVAEVKDAVDGINETLATLNTTVAALAKIKLTGYVQSQFTSAVWAGGNAGVSTSGPTAIGNFQGGALSAGVASRFLVRRGRLKVMYDNDLTQYVMQIDVTQGGVGIKDMYVYVKEPWLKTFALTAGVFDRPFGFEISYSSSSREAPERTRMYQTLFPGERELGMKLEVTPSENMGALSLFNLKVGVFNGTGPTANEVDNVKDVIGRLGISLPFQEQNVALDAGVSFYSGSIKNTTKYVYNKGNIVDSTTSNNNAFFDRNYIGVDAQLYADVLPIGGSSLRAEVITGKQPGTKDDNRSLGSISYPFTSGMWVRNFLGYYAALIQNFGLNHQLVVRYDAFYPNTDVDSKHIGEPKYNVGLGDLSYTTIGFGWVYYYDANVKFVVYYDKITNDKVYAKTTSSTYKPFIDDVKDDVFTFRIQYKF
jgi:Flp pilus assembly protein TadG